jgi:hypothetical protein
VIIREQGSPRHPSRYPQGVADKQDRPAWAERLRTERLARGWSQADVVAAMRTFSDAAGQDAAPGRSVAVQLLAQEAKAWARMGNQRNVVKALEKGRVLLDSLP